MRNCSEKQEFAQENDGRASVSVTAADVKTETGRLQIGQITDRQEPLDKAFLVRLKGREYFKKHLKIMDMITGLKQLYFCKRWSFVTAISE